MSGREHEIIRMALVYLQANLADACEAFGYLDEEGPGLSINGDQMDIPTENEVAECLKQFQ